MDQTTPFNLADIAKILNQRKRLILLFTLLSVGLATIIVFFLPPQYKSTAVVVATNPVLADKARIYNENVEHLYSTFGGEDDLTRLLGIADLDTTHKILVKKFNLIKYYKIRGTDAALNQRQAIKALREDINFIKNERQQLKISVVTKDKHLSASIANSIVEIIQDIVRDINKIPNESTLNKLATSSRELEQRYAMLSDSTGADAILMQVKREAILEQLRQNEKVVNQLKLTIANNIPALMILEKAYPSAKADKPKKLMIISGALLASLAFSILMVLIFERSR